MTRLIDRVRGIFFCVSQACCKALSWIGERAKRMDELCGEEAEYAISSARQSKQEEGRT